MRATDGQLFSDMQAFVAVAQRGGFARAAEQLGADPPNVSRAVARLESRLGLRLLHRTTRSVSLTSSGSGYLAHCLKALGAFDEAQEFIASEQRGISGSLKITMPMSFGLTQLGPILSAFSATYPQVQVEATVTDELLDLTAQRIDVAIRIGVSIDHRLHSRVLGQTERLLCASPAYLRQHGAPGAPRDLLDHRCLVYSGRPQANLWALRSGEHEDSVRVTPALSANNSLVLRDLALQGSGIAPIAHYVVQELLASGALQRVLPAWSLGSLDICAVYLTARHMAPKVRAFIDFCAQGVQQRWATQPAPSSSSISKAIATP